MDKTEQLGTEPIYKLIMRFSIPSIIAMFVNAVYNIIDRVFVGKYVGEYALGGLTVAFPFMLILMSIGALIGIGGAAILSIKFGQKKNDEAQQIFGNIISLTIIASLLGTFLGLIFMTPLLNQMGASPSTFPFAADYMRMILIGQLIQMGSFTLASIARVEGNPKLSMISQILGGCTNIVLDYIFIVVIPMGVFGAALATVLGQAVSLTLLSWHFFIAKKSLLKFHIKHIKLKLRIVKEIFAIGASSFFMQLGSSLSTVFLNIALGKYGGDNAITSMGAINSLFTMVLMPIIGLQQGIAPIVGYNFGMKQKNRVRRTLLLATIIGMVFSTLIFFALQIWPVSFVSLFLDKDSPTMPMCVEGLKIFILILPFLPLSIIGTAFFQSTAQTVKAFIASISRQILFLIPAVLILPLFLDIRGVWLAIPASELLSLLLVIFFLFLSRDYLIDDNKNAAK